MRKLTAVPGAALLGAILLGVGLAQRPAATPAPARDAADLVLLGGKVFTIQITLGGRDEHHHH